MVKKIFLNSNRKGFNKLMKFLNSRRHLLLHRTFNATVRQQVKDPMSIPVIIISFNQLYYLQRLVDFLKDIGLKNIVILDNNSSYPPLLKYFAEIEQHVTIIRKQSNLGHLSFWKHEDVFQKYSKGYYVVTDADIVPVADCPSNFMDHLRSLLDRAYDRTKVGFSLKIDDIPVSNKNKSEIIEWESKYWKSMISEGVFKAEVDTTFAMYRPGYEYQLKDFTKAWRTDFPYQAIHGGWYIDIHNLTEEQQYYMKTANESASWQIDESGELINKIHKPLYSNE